MIGETRNGKVIKRLALVGLLFLFVVFIFPGEATIEILNGVFIGVVTILTTLYWRVTYNTLFGRGEYRRAQQMVLGLFFLWAYAVLTRLTSIAYRASGEQAWILNLPTSVLSLFLVIIAGYLMFTAPGFDDGYMHRESRKRIALAGVFGAIVGIGAIWLQSGFMH